MARTHRSGLLHGGSAQHGSSCNSTLAQGPAPCAAQAPVTPETWESSGSTCASVQGSPQPAGMQAAPARTASSFTSRRKARSWSTSVLLLAALLAAVLAPTALAITPPDYFCRNTAPSLGNTCPLCQQGNACNVSVPTFEWGLVCVLLLAIAQRGAAVARMLHGAAHAHMRAACMMLRPCACMLRIPSDVRIATHHPAKQCLLPLPSVLAVID